MIALAVLAVCSFLQVFTLGFQSRCVNAGNYPAAFVCSSIIGFAQVAVWKHIQTDAQGIVAASVYSFSGAIAIITAIFIHKKVFPRER
jgi:hypothetical protein